MLIGPLLLLTTLKQLSGLEPTALANEGEVTVVPSEVRYVEARHSETVIRGRPWVPHKRVATIAGGTRLVVRGEVASRDKEGCSGKTWYAVLPFGFVCSEHVRKTEDPPASGGAMPPLPGKRLPHSYTIVRHDGVPEYASVADVQAGIVRRELVKSMSIVVRRSVEIDGASYIESQHGAIVPREGIGWMGEGSDWQGVALDGFVQGPAFAWTNADKTIVRSEPKSDAEKVRTLGKRERVHLLEPSSTSRPQWWRVGAGEWIDADQLNEVIVIAPPEGVLEADRVAATGNDQWVDVDIGEQVLVAYRGTTPVFTTLVATGRSSPTPLGNYPIWAKVATMDMNNQDYEDKPYMVQGVPWVLLFQGHNALHGAYWHDRFGNKRSHGCVNLAPLDARWVFDWAGPTLPRGWTGYLPLDLGHSPVVHVRDSSREEGLQFTQARPIGPPDREEERKKNEAAERRRAAETPIDARSLDDAPIWPEMSRDTQ
ncbi:MAG TPA: L,D-transpeptidase [Nannocystaceae bacterium]|nr:L,D-transpeptidase [Nannocystaceae bacterium]